jgi:hypothetical protein
MLDRCMVIGLSDFDMQVKGISRGHGRRYLNNPLCEAIDMFGSLLGIAKNRARNIPGLSHFFVVLTKDDLFRSKLSRYGPQRSIELIQLVWPRYHGDGSYDNIIAFIIQQFSDSSKDGNGCVKGIYVVNSFDNDLTNNVLSTFQSIMEYMEVHVPIPIGPET